VLFLDGRLRHSNGILPMMDVARDHGIHTVFVPAVDAAEAALIEGACIIPVETLAALVGYVRREAPIAPAAPLSVAEGGDPFNGPDFAAVRRPEHVKRALEVAAAGGHNVVVL